MNYNKSKICIAIDASRNRSGGSIAHLIGIISESDPELDGISEIHVWSYESLLKKLPNKPWLKKHNPSYLEKSIVHQLFWQIFLFNSEFKQAKCDILLNTDAGTMSFVKPAVTMSRDMLSYEPGEISRYGISLSRLRLLILRYIQSSSLKRASGAIFLTKYAAEVIQKHCGELSNIQLIPHGISEHFRRKNFKDYAHNANRALTLLYVSNTDYYKHQWHVVSAAELLWKKGYIFKLRLVGGGQGSAQERLENQIKKSDPHAEFVELRSHVPYKDIPMQHADAEIFVFASSCENMPNTLIEAMAAGMPIACSDRGPMPEVLKDGGLYFDPENSDSIATALEKLINSKALRDKLADRAESLSRRYSWKKCANETWAFLRKTCALMNK